MFFDRTALIQYRAQDLRTEADLARRAARVRRPEPGPRLIGLRIRRPKVEVGRPLRLA